MKFCPNCGSTVPDEHKFCINCGASMAPPPPPEPEAYWGRPDGAAPQQNQSPPETDAAQPVWAQSPPETDATQPIWGQNPPETDATQPIWGQSPPESDSTQPVWGQAASQPSSGQNTWSAPQPGEPVKDYNDNYTYSPYPPENGSPPPKKSKAWILIVVVSVLVVALIAGIILIFANMGHGEEKLSSSTSPVISSQPEINSSAPAIEAPSSEEELLPEPEPSSEPEPDPVKFSGKFSPGFYVAGVDFPVGTYDLTAVEGGGNVTSTNGLNIVMGTKEKNKYTDIYEQEYKNAKMPQGTVLNVSDGTIKLTCDKADGHKLPKRTEDKSKKITLKSGEYVVGEDLPAGTYNLVAVKGGGNVSTDDYRDYFLNAIMGTKDKNKYTDMYVQTYKNVQMNEGVTLKIKNVTIDLIPVTVNDGSAKFLGTWVTESVTVSSGTYTLDEIVEGYGQDTADSYKMTITINTGGTGTFQMANNIATELTWSMQDEKLIVTDSTGTAALTMKDGKLLFGSGDTIVNLKRK